MTGRDMRSFLSNHRIGRKEIARDDKTDKLVVRMKEGLGSSRYARVDYDKLKSYTLDKKISGNLMLMKMQKLSSFSKANRENNLIKQHCSAWLKECTRLESLRKRTSNDCDLFIDHGTLENSIITMFMFDVEDYIEELKNDLKQFKSATLEPVWTLREDLQSWMSQNEDDLHNPSENLVFQQKNICSVIDSVKAQETEILDKLRYEQLCIESELKGLKHLQDVMSPFSKMVLEGIPDEAYILECPDGDLKSQVLEQFLVLDECYKMKLRDLDSKHLHIIGNPMDGWEEEDHLVFQSTVERYPPTCPNRRTLYLDMLKRLLPHKTRADFVTHEEWIIGDRFYNETRKVLIKCWARDKQELFNRVASTFADACLAKELEFIKAINRQKQKQICQELEDKLKIWHEQKQEALQLEAEIFARNQEKLHRKQMKELEKEKKRRATKKLEIDEFHVKLEKAQAQQREADEKRLAELKEEMAKQAIHDQQRVEFREQLLIEREKMKEEERELKKEDLKREQRLDALRQQVEVHVDYDPVRMMQDTVASNAKKGIGVQEDINMQKPLFDLVSFTSETVQADPRLRMEEALRKAGLHENPYAKMMLATIKPIKPPRRDMLSVGMKQVMTTEHTEY
ncbi:coiled-coil domain-containing protein 148-like [Antedon mediterranea]|uniref:coiled-coil domain-containing protein 148-like n=1 Tax=Antedon mediterranea TaxID=105859 RepID=UPI003AF46C56